MDPVLSKFLHDIGFPYGKRKFKLFTFSKVIGKLIKKGNILTFEPEITLYFASPLIDIVSSSAKTFLKKNSLRLGRNNLELVSIEVIKPKVDEEITVRCLSPITVYKTPEGEKRFRYLNPWEEEFYQLIKKNLIKKYEIIYGRSYKEHIEVEPVKISKNYRKKVVYRGTLIEAWEGYYKLKGSQDILRIALEAGLGSKNPQGFGMVERIL